MMSSTGTKTQALEHQDDKYDDASDEHAGQQRHADPTPSRFLLLGFQRQFAIGSRNPEDAC
jgi:hypothetical protein